MFSSYFISNFSFHYITRDSQGLNLNSRSLLTELSFLSLFVVSHWILHLFRFSLLLNPPLQFFIPLPEFKTSLIFSGLKLVQSLMLMLGEDLFPKLNTLLGFQHFLLSLLLQLQSLLCDNNIKHSIIVIHI